MVPLPGFPGGVLPAIAFLANPSRTWSGLPGNARTDRASRFARDRLDYHADNVTEAEPAGRGAFGMGNGDPRDRVISPSALNILWDQLEGRLVTLSWVMGDRRKSSSCNKPSLIRLSDKQRSPWIKTGPFN